MKLWKRMAALTLSISTVGMTMLSTACEDISGALSNFLPGSSQDSVLESSETSNSDSAKPHTHVWVETIVLQPTCTERGVKKIACDCGEERFEELAATHDLVHSREAEATCSQEGIIRIYCNNCEYEVYETEDVEEHTFMFSGQCFWCGKTKTEIENEQNNITGTAVSYDGSPVTIQFYHTMSNRAQGVLNSYIAEFNKLYPNIEIDHQTLGGYDTLRNQIVNGDVPHIAYCYNDHVALYNKADMVMTLDEYIANTDMVSRADGSTEKMGFTQEEIDGFVRAYYEEGCSYGDGKMYTLPYSKSTEVLYYNKTFFVEHGLTVPTTWDEMETVMQQIVEIDPNSIPLSYDSDANLFITMCEQLNSSYTSTVEGEKFLFDVGVNHDFVARVREWYQNGYAITGLTYGGYTSGLFTQTEAASQKSYMCIASSAGASYHCPSAYVDKNGQRVYPFEVGVAMLPQVDPENPKVISQGPSLCMFKKADSQEMAATWLFMKFLSTNLDLQAEFSITSGYAPVIEDLHMKHEVYAMILEMADGNANLQATCVKQCLLQQDAMFVSPAFVGSAAARDYVGELIAYACLYNPVDGQSVADFIKAGFEMCIDALTEEYGS